MNLYLVRHGQTDWNKNNLLQGRTDVKLNETGKSQAIETAKKFKNIKIDLLVVSPLSRALETAKTINKILNKQIIIDERLLERGFGNYEGEQRVKFKKYWDYKSNYSDNNVEPIRELFERVLLLLNELEEKYKDKNILIVTHNGVNLAISSILKGEIPDNIFENNMLPCEVKVFENVDLGKWRNFSGKYKI